MSGFLVQSSFSRDAARFAPPMHEVARAAERVSRERITAPGLPETNQRATRAATEMGRTDTSQPPSRKGNTKCSG